MGNLKAFFENLSSWVVVFSTVTFIIDKSIFMEVMIGDDMQVLKQIGDFIIKIFKFLWGKDIEYTPDEFYSDTRILKPEQIWLFLRRFLVLVLCYMVVSKIYVSLNMSWNNYKACRGKDICIIQGPDMPYPMYYPIVSDIIKDRYILVIHRQKAELYDIKRNKFKIVEDSPFDYGLTSATFVFVDTSGKVVLKEARNSESFQIFDIKTRKFEKFDSSKFGDSFFNYIQDIIKIYPVYGITKIKKDILLNINIENFKKRNIRDIKLQPDAHLNIFTYKRKKKDIVFVNRGSTYVLRNDNNIEKAEDNFNKVNQEILSRVNDKSRYYYATDARSLSYIPISDTKILFFNNSNSLVDGYDAYSSENKRTFIYDVAEDKFYEGPSFKYTPIVSSFQKIAENKWIFFGGGHEYYSPKKYTQILIVKNR